MRESRLYLNFFRRNAWILVVVGLLGGLVGYGYQQNQPAMYSTTRMFVLDESRMVAAEGIVKLDQAVALIRAEQMRGELGLDGSSQVVVYKNSPLSVLVSVSNPAERQGLVDLNGVVNYLLANFPVNEVGQEVRGQSSVSPLLGGLVGGIVGLSGGLLLALLRAYWSNF